jgi:hypothetical protein
MSAEASARDFEAGAATMRGEYDVFPRQTWAAMQAARKGHWIEDTEEHVRDAGEVFRPRASAKLLQMQVQAGQASIPLFAGRGVGTSAAGPRNRCARACRVG